MITKKLVANRSFERFGNSLVGTDRTVRMEGWKWREQIDDGNYEKENERIAKLRADDERFSKAIKNRFVSPGAPDSGMLLRLHGMRSNDPTTWPTLRELKLATALPERTIKRIIAGSQPEPRQTEIATIPLRHIFSKRGAMPHRYAPRLVVAVLKEFVNRLAELPIAVAISNVAAVFFVRLDSPSGV